MELYALFLQSLETEGELAIMFMEPKAMVTTFTSGLRQRLHKSNVTVVTIKPGFVDTPMTAKFNKGVLWVKPNKVAKKKIVQQLIKKKSEVYVPYFGGLS